MVPGGVRVVNAKQKLGEMDLIVPRAVVTKESMMVPIVGILQGICRRSILSVLRGMGGNWIVRIRMIKSVLSGMGRGWIVRIRTIEGVESVLRGDGRMSQFYRGMEGSWSKNWIVRIRMVGSSEDKIWWYKGDIVRRIG